MLSIAPLILWSGYVCWRTESIVLCVATRFASIGMAGTLMAQGVVKPGAVHPIVQSALLMFALRHSSGHY